MKKKIKFTVVNECWFKQCSHCSQNGPSILSLEKTPKIFPWWLILICSIISSKFFSSFSFRVMKLKFRGAFSLLLCSLSIWIEKHFKSIENDEVCYLLVWDNWFFLNQQIWSLNLDKRQQEHHAFRNRITMSIDRKLY